jgi:hypothetical protein
MKEYGQHKTKAQHEAEKWGAYMVDKDGDYVCSVCKKVWIPTVDDVNRKRPSTYYKLCSACRFKSFLCARLYKKEKGNNYDALYDTSN